MDYLQRDTLLKTRLRQLNEQVVRDLAWCCLSPPLMAEDSRSPLPPLLDERLWTWLYHLDSCPHALLNLIQQRKSTRLGLYYESLWLFYFMQHPAWELLAYNQQIHQDGLTLGAFDFLCKQDNNFWHFETAVKFYLCAAPSSTQAQDWHQWIGPNKSDRLDIKLHHLHQHQLSLSKNPTAKHWLDQHFPGVDKWQTALCFQGYFFHANESQTPHQAHPHYCRGRWLTLDHFLESAADVGTHPWLVLERNQWLSPAQTMVPQQLLTTAELNVIAINNLAGENRPLLVATMNDWGNVWQEDKRFFLVPNEWPSVASR